MGSTKPPLAIHRFHADRHRQLCVQGCGVGRTSAVVDLLAIAPTLFADGHGRLSIRAPVWRQVAKPGKRMTSQFSDELKRQKQRQQVCLNVTHIFVFVCNG
jgi:hypothetical protein